MRAFQLTKVCIACGATYERGKTIGSVQWGGGEALDLLQGARVFWYHYGQVRRRVRAESVAA